MRRNSSKTLPPSRKTNVRPNKISRRRFEFSRKFLPDKKASTTHVEGLKRFSKMLCVVFSRKVFHQIEGLAFSSFLERKCTTSVCLFHLFHLRRARDKKKCYKNGAAEKGSLRFKKSECLYTVVANNGVSTVLTKSVVRSTIRSFRDSS